MCVCVCVLAYFPPTRQKAYPDRPQTLSLSLTHTHTHLLLSPPSPQVLFLIGTRISGVLRDCAVVELTRRSVLAADEQDRRAGGEWVNHINPISLFRQHIPNMWHVAVMSLMYMRWCILIPLVIMSTPLCVMYRGSDAVNVAMDAVAVLFVLNIDTLVFNHGMSEDMKGYVMKYGERRRRKREK